MRINDAAPSYLTLSDSSEPSYFKVALHGSLSDAMSGWNSSTRVSPIWEVGGPDNIGSGDTNGIFKGSTFLIFIGPCSPVQAFGALDSLPVMRKWVSVGAFNNIALIGETDPDLVQGAILEWVTSSRVPAELWPLTDGQFGKPLYLPPPTGIANDLRNDLAEFAANEFSPTLASSVQEYCCLMASCAARSAQVAPSFLDELKDTHESVIGLVPKGKTPPKNERLEARANLTSINAALSRFSSQAFSGISPIIQTECHFWTHSLLGIGAANIALANFVQFVGFTLGHARLPERVENLRHIHPGYNFTRMRSDNGILDSAPGNTNPIAAPERLVPLITYFSGRDGFSRHLQTVSAPLFTIAEANSFRSSLLTITHEICHVVTDGILSELYPNLEPLNDGPRPDHYTLDDARRILKTPPEDAYETMLESAQRLLADAVISMECASPERAENSEPWRVFEEEFKCDATFASFFRRWRKESQEIFVHTLDYLYFYNGNSSFYVYSIWHSWCSIHGIIDRVPEYLRRTLSAISAHSIQEDFDTQFDRLVLEVKGELERLIKEDIEGVEMAQEALRFLEENASKGSFRVEMRARLHIVRLVRIFLYSEELAAEINYEPHVSSKGRSANKSEYSMERLHFQGQQFANPIRFIRNYTESDPSEGFSLWVLLSLAFEYKRKEAS